MVIGKIPDTPYPELLSVLETFVSLVTKELKENLVGIYLVGSLASGGFDLDSDIDFLVVTESDLSESNRTNLQMIQSRIYGIDCYPAKHLEGSYISLTTLNDRNLVGKRELFYFDNGSTEYEMSIHDNNWHVRWILRECGITLTGRDPEKLLPPIPRKKLAEEMKSTLILIRNEHAKVMDKPLSFFNSQFGQSFTVLTCCRILHTLHTGRVMSKIAGVQWACENIDSKWRTLVNKAWEDREGVRFGVKINQPAPPDLCGKTLTFIDYSLSSIPLLPGGESPLPESHGY